MSALSRRSVALLALVLALAPASARAQDAALKQAANEIEDALEAWDLDEARGRMDQLLAEQGDNPAVKPLLARLRFEQGDYAGAVALYDEIGAQGSWSSLARATLKEFEGYEQRESEHFVFRYKPGKDAALAPYALDALEKQYAALKSDLGYAPPGKVRVEMVANAKGLSHVSTLSLDAIMTSGTIAICKFNRLMVTSPKALVHGYGWVDTLAHEYTHLVVSKMSRNEVPIWIHEGLAKYLESRWRGKPGLALSPAAAALLAEAFKKNKLIPFERMHPSMALLPSQEDAALAFAEVFTAIEFLHQKGGNEALRGIVERLKAKESYQDAVGKAVGGPFTKFEGEWKGYLSRREFPRETIPLSAERLKFKESAPNEKKDEKAKKPKEELRFGDFLEIEDADARKRAHLGEILRTRKRPRAAVEEFAFAQGRAGNRSPILNNKHAQALIELKDYPKAEQLLLASLKPYPNYTQTHVNLGTVYMEQKRFDEAEKAWMEVIYNDPFDPVPHAQLAKIYEGRGDAKRARLEQEEVKILVRGKGTVMPNNGLIHVESHPFAKIFVDGKDTGVTTPADVEVPPGRHVVTLVNEERAFREERTLEVGTGEEKTLEVSAPEPAPAAAPNAPAAPATR